MMIPSVTCEVTDGSLTAQRCLETSEPLHVTNGSHSVQPVDYIDLRNPSGG